VINALLIAQFEINLSIQSYHVVICILSSEVVS